jgi:DNA-binding MarR family transcriptional regulator
MAALSSQQLRALRVIDRQQRSGEDGHDCEGDLSMCSRNWPATHHSLVRRGLVVATFDGIDVWSPWTYRLTDAGREAITEAAG